MIEFRDALTDLLDEFGTDDHGQLFDNAYLISYHSPKIFSEMVIYVWNQLCFPKVASYRPHPKDGEGNIFIGVCPLPPTGGGGGGNPLPRSGQGDTPLPG